MNLKNKPFKAIVNDRNCILINPVYKDDDELVKKAIIKDN